MTIEDAVKLLANYKDEIEKYAEIDINYVSKMLEIKPGEAVYLMIFMFLRKEMECVRYRDQYLQKERDNDYLKQSILELGKNGREIQKTKVKNGMPIAKKKKCIYEMRLLAKSGYKDDDMMEHFGISRTTLWRWKKEERNMK